MGNLEINLPLAVCAHHSAHTLKLVLNYILHKCQLISNHSLTTYLFLGLLPLPVVKVSMALFAAHPSTALVGNHRLHFTLVIDLTVAMFRFCLLKVTKVTYKSTPCKLSPYISGHNKFTALICLFYSVEITLIKG